jgi:hypothetical protein
VHNALVGEFPPDDRGLEEEEGVKQVGMGEGCDTRRELQQGGGGGGVQRTTRWPRNGEEARGEPERSCMIGSLRARR